MAVRQGKVVRRDDGVVVYTWTGLGGGDTGSPALLNDAGDIDVQVIGTIGTSVITMQGSMDGTNFATMASSPTPWVAATISRITQRALYIRPDVAAGTGANLTIIACVVPPR